MMSDQNAGFVKTSSVIGYACYAACLRCNAVGWPVVSLHTKHTEDAAAHARRYVATPCACSNIARPHMQIQQLHWYGTC